MGEILGKLIMRKIVIGIMIALSVMAFSFAIADTLAKGTGGWFGPIIFLVINCTGLYCAYRFIIWYSKNAGNTRQASEDEEVVMLIRNKANKKKNGSAQKADL